MFFWQNLVPVNPHPKPCRLHVSCFCTNPCVRPTPPLSLLISKKFVSSRQKRLDVVAAARADFLLIIMRQAEGSPLCCIMMCHRCGMGVGQNEATEPWDTSRNTHTSPASLCEPGRLLYLIKKLSDPTKTAALWIIWHLIGGGETPSGWWRTLWGAVGISRRFRT